MTTPKADDIRGAIHRVASGPYFDALGPHCDAHCRIRPKTGDGVALDPGSGPG